MASTDGASAWGRVDCSVAGMIVPGDEAGVDAQCRGWMAFAVAAHRGQSFLYWSQLRGIGEFLDLALAEVGAQVHDGVAERDLLDPWTVTVEEVAIGFAVPTGRARALVAEAMAAADRLPGTSELLRDGVIDPDMFTTVVDRTDIVDDPQILAAVDADLASGLGKAGHISVRAARRIADRVVARRDVDADRRRRDKNRSRTNVVHRDRGEGLGALTITADAEESRLALEAVTALAKGCCPNDPRTPGQRRSAAAIARLRRVPFTCACGDEATCTATLSDDEVSERQARIVIHAVCQKSILEPENAPEKPAHNDDAGGADDADPDSGADSRGVAECRPCADSAGGGEPAEPDRDTPGYLDGHGPISAEQIRRLAERPDALVRDLDLDNLLDPDDGLIDRTYQEADPYRPTATLDALVRALFGTCTIPGCERAAWNCQLDHVEEFDQVCPATGGPTCLCNVDPKCLKHHQIKTHLGAQRPQDGWVDELWVDDSGVFWTSVTTGHGITVDSRAENQWLLPQLTGLRCRHRGSAATPLAESQPDHTIEGRRSTTENRVAETRGGGRQAATAYKHAWRKSVRAKNRELREQAARDAGPPPF
ncbi:DUF222 domain-containing protein [Gordonia sp. VNK21]|uniref:DUF222 domain-containing protein n=1 Tax=Gordonia sp. VNK21 TaxID=3382483 RepID=UPI0038D4A5D5